MSEAPKTNNQARSSTPSPAWHTLSAQEVSDHFDVDTAATSKKYCDDRRALLAKYGLGCWAISNHLAGQLVRSGTSVSLNYGEAQSGESRKDFIHKMKVVLKELRETFACLRIIDQAGFNRSGTSMEKAKKENNELISIFVKSIETAQKNLAAGKGYPSKD